MGQLVEMHRRGRYEQNDERVPVPISFCLLSSHTDTIHLNSTVQCTFEYTLQLHHRFFFFFAEVTRVIYFRISKQSELIFNLCDPFEFNVFETILLPSVSAYLLSSHILPFVPTYSRILLGRQSFSLSSKTKMKMSLISVRLLILVGVRKKVFITFHFGKFPCFQQDARS